MSSDFFIEYFLVSYMEGTNKFLFLEKAILLGKGSRHKIYR